MNEENLKSKQSTENPGSPAEETETIQDGDDGSRSPIVQDRGGLEVSSPADGTGEVAEQAEIDKQQDIRGA
ncbi:hypothetical protein [Scytonema sp. PCC 10023]|uniref:hypothetical protein n=1 Tax=Scytonema sp. PCC 10023 TaxID=1680591 RepID=UPI0039C5F8DF